MVELLLEEYLLLLRIAREAVENALNALI